MAQPNEQWQEFEELVKEDKPELWAEFDEAYEDPSYDKDEGCSFCGARVLHRSQHRKWHRATSFRHFVLAAAAKEWLVGLAKMNEVIDEVVEKLVEE